MSDSRRRLVIVGGGEHARVVVEAARSASFEVVGFVDPLPCEETARRLGLPRLGGDDYLERVGGVGAVVGVGSTGVSSVRARIAARLAPHVRWHSVVHASAWVSPTASLAEGAVVMAGATVQSGARIGRHAVINTGAVVEHDVRIGDFAQLGPRATVGGAATVGEGTFIGMGATVRDHITLGPDTLVAMGAVVVRSVAGGATVKGVPAR